MSSIDKPTQLWKATSGPGRRADRRDLPMPRTEDTHAATCPYCGEPIDLVIDASVDEQTNVEDCHVCCQELLLNEDPAKYPVDDEVLELLATAHKKRGDSGDRK
jgi:hypothetical protein